MKLTDCIIAADNAAGQVWRMANGPSVFSWRECLGRPRASVAAQWVAANRAGTAEQLYVFLCNVASERDAKAWDKIPAALRVALETFRATFLILVLEAERNDRRVLDLPNPKVTGNVRAFSPVQRVTTSTPDPAA